MCHYVYQLMEAGSTEPRYTGITGCHRTRLSRYRSVINSPSKKHRKEPVNEWLRAIGVENLEMTVVARCRSEETAARKEQRLIRQQTHVSIGGLNVRRK